MPPLSSPSSFTIAQHLSAFDLVVFDCDGVIVDSEVLSCACLRRALARHGFDFEIADIYARFLGKSLASIEAYCRDEAGRALPSDFAAELHDELSHEFSQALTPISGIERVLAGLSVPFCLASSSPPERLDLSLTVTGLKRYFEGRIFSAVMVKHGKPAPDLFLLAAQRMGADPARAVVIEDSVSGVTAGKAAGMTVWGFVGGGHHAGRGSGALLKEAGADLILESMDHVDL